MIELTRDGHAFILRMNHGENRFGPDFMSGFDAALDEVEKTDGPKALVTTGTGKFYSNGLDLDYMMSGAVDANAYVKRVLGIMARVVAFPAFTVAAVNGHAFGAGAQIQLAHDHRLMRRDRGYFCMPEIDMRAPLHPGMTAIIQARLPRQTAHEVVVTGTRYGGEQARACGIVEEAVGEDELLPRAVEIANRFAEKAHPSMSVLKRGMYGDVLEAMAADLQPGAV